MNICAVRTFAEHHCWPLMDPLLPHEPASEQRLAVMEIGEADILGNYVGTYALCRHCGCLYSTSEEE
jgi:hypothetical protein